MASARTLGRRWLVLAALAACTGPALAATIYGTLTSGGQALVAELTLQCGDKSLPGKSDARGAYRFTVERTGSCELRVAGAVATVVVYNEPTRYDYDLRRSANTAALVRR
ncbi:MAG: hypothetical protein KA151_14635 [Piscinibacter sp.]|nr:hypothetical protein [Piscinibacter sp.]